MAGIAVPKLCATDTLEAFGSCRLCLVEVEGGRGTPASCTLAVADGMRVSTQSRSSTELRRGVMELYISDHPLDCLTCPANGDCELQDMAGVVGLRDVRYGYDGREPPGRPEGHEQPVLRLRRRASASSARAACGPASDVQGTFALTISGRGFDSKVTAGDDGAFMDSECVSCGACVQACPTVDAAGEVGRRSWACRPARS